MKTRRIHSDGPATRRAFTLLELLAVMSIMAILLAITVPAIAALNESINVAQGGQLLADQIGVARQISSSRNITVEVRCITVPVRSDYGYTAIQLWSSSTGQAIPVSRVQDLPDGIAISQDTTKVSPLFGSYISTGLMPAGGPMGGDKYVSFTINPSGMVGPLGANNIPNMTALTVGVVAERYATSATLAKNYALIQINPLTAATIIYRP